MSLYDPRNRKELYYRGILDQAPGSLPEPQTREEIYLKAIAEHTSKYYGSPLTAASGADMTDKDRVYVYTGTEAGYTAGDWYYWNGSAWSDGGVYNAVVVQTDTTLTQPGVAADAKATGDKISYVVVDKGYQKSNQSNPGFTVLPNKTVAAGGGVTTSTNQSVWQMVADRDFHIYFSASNYAPTGGYLALGVNGGRYRSNDNNLPTAGSPISVSQGSTVNIAVYTSGSVFAFWWDNLGNEINPTAITEIDDAVNKYIRVSVDSGNANSAKIYIPSKRKGSNYFFEVQLIRNINAASNVDVWRLDTVYLDQLIDNEFTNRVNIVSGGEWACALKIKGASDFMGGSYHGDEILNNGVILIDKAPHTFTAGESIYCQSITVIENTNLYNPDVANEHAATVARQIEITSENITISQRVKWKRSYTMDLSYLGMFCIMRTVTDRGYSDTEYIPYDIGTQGFNNPLYINNANCITNRRLFAEYGTSSKLFFEMRTDYISPDIPNRPTYIYNGTPYNKMYSSFCPDNYAVTAGDIWEATNVYKMVENKVS